MSAVPNPARPDPESGARRACLPEAQARQVSLLRACESAAAAPALWSPEDVAWATRLANETVGGGAAPEAWLAERAHHAMQRLLPRERKLAALLRPGLARPALLAALVVAAAALGALAEGLDSRAQINLLAPPILALLAWNALVLPILVWQSLRGHAGQGRVRRWLAARAQHPAVGRGGPWPIFAADWSERAAPLALARAALAMHLAAAALAAGLVLGMYLRGLVLDYRAGWQSTFLDAESVHGLLTVLLAPARALSGIAGPDAAGVAAMRVMPGQAATASAAPWIHLWAATLAIFVIAPRLLLALAAALQAWQRSRCIELPLAQPYYQRLLAAARRTAMRVQVLAHGAPPAAAAVLGLRSLFAAVCGETVVLSAAATTTYGDEDRLPAPGPGCTLRVVLVELTATPEPDVQGRFIAALRAATPALPLIVVADAAQWNRRFAAWPERTEQRRAAWQALARSHEVGFMSVDLEAADDEGARRDLETLLNAGP